MNQHESTFAKEENIRCIRPILCVAVVGQSLYCSKPPVALPGLQTLALLRCSDLSDASRGVEKGGLFDWEMKMG